ncbi:predicted protein [Naegleria gruberi]|uniref:Predicted protein n=1 Tax=Naegleria gruberi TaxID=5762 RepID=D2UYZ8_NAEGR|nr:uncharacterized protein NAEGRDRAFT_77874 [Naegleria gruberi]EFC49862.1 predicted protein [Naegleria gruberi]|eukprot:XP_002682606.1 predicted protein [Naegleria gruberi strain NEG-M]
MSTQQPPFVFYPTASNNNNMQQPTFNQPPQQQQPNVVSGGVPQHPFVYYPQVVMGQNGQQQYILSPPPRFTQPTIYTTPVVMDQQASSSIPLENNLQQVDNQNTTRSCSWSSCRSSKFCKYVKENRWFTGQIVVTILMAILCIAAIAMYPMVGGVMAFKILLSVVCCVAAYKKKYLALSFFSGSILVDLLLSSFIIGLVGSSSHSDYNYVNPALTLPFQISFHILELTFLVICLVLTAKIHREVHSTSVPAQENVVPVLSTETPVVANTSSQENYSRLQDEQESQQEAVQRYYPSLNNNNNH